MKRKRILGWIVFVAMLGFLFLGWCTNNSTNVYESLFKTKIVEVPVVHSSPDKIFAVTKGNFSYIPLLLYNEDHPISEILATLNNFEKDHPELEITSWNIERKGRFVPDSFCFGLWVNHRPRSK